jgi:hypothetical protein
MLTSGLIWRWLAHRMERRGVAGGTITPPGRTLPLVASYTFSQLGKYIPGKVALLLMRIERARRFGMSPRICTLSTILENALYMISGGLVGMVAIVKVASVPEMEKYRLLLWPVTAGAMAVLAVGCYPPVFYGLVNRLLRKMKREEVGRDAWLGLGTLVTGVIAFVPCWFFGGIALWSSARAIHDINLADSGWFAGAYALSVIIGMASLLPGGAGVRDAMLGAAAVLQFQQAGVGHAQAVVLGGVVAILQRLFQVIAELIMGGLGGALTGGLRSNPVPSPIPQGHEAP